MTKNPLTIEGEIIYPETDGKPMAENTEQFDWIVLIKLGLEAVFEKDEKVFIAGDLFWYPVEGRPDIVYAPDVMVVFGRPKGKRRSYLQWKEENITPQVIFEILSPGNSYREMQKKHKFYEKYGVEEYYIYDPESNDLFGWLGKNNLFESIEEMQNWQSPRLNIRFELTEDTLCLYRPDGEIFATYLEIIEFANQAKQEAEEAKQEAEEAKQEAEEAKRKSKVFAKKLKEMGINPDEI